MKLTLLYAGFETRNGPSTQGAGTKTNFESRCRAGLVYIIRVRLAVVTHGTIPLAWHPYLSSSKHPTLTFPYRWSAIPIFQVVPTVKRLM